MRAVGDKLFVLGPSDPEIEIFEISTTTQSNSVSIYKVGTYDAPGLSGNGRSLDFINDSLLFGRSRGNEEFNILRMFSTSTQNSLETFRIEPVKSLKVSASIDSIITASSSAFIVTSDQAKEFQLIAYGAGAGINTNTVSRVGYLDLPSRANDFICVSDTVFVGSVDPVHTLVRIKIKNSN
jgi:hypothetical protein